MAINWIHPCGGLNCGLDAYEASLWNESGMVSLFVVQWNEDRLSCVGGWFLRIRPNWTSTHHHQFATIRHRKWYAKCIRVQIRTHWLSNSWWEWLWSFIVLWGCILQKIKCYHIYNSMSVFRPKNRCVGDDDGFVSHCICTRIQIRINVDELLIVKQFINTFRTGNLNWICIHLMSINYSLTD